MATLKSAAKAKKTAAVVEEVKETAVQEEKAAPVKKTAAKKTTTAKTEKAPAKKTGCKKSAKKPEVEKAVYFEFRNKQVRGKDIIAAVEAAYAAEGNDTAAIEDIKVYVKAEDNAAYYVINGTVNGKIDL